ncbi:MAG: putative multidrug resistance protein MdtD [Burkholderiaceae bacterium]|nr:putative multidrug resistance protein MdtD [Burkholderiaceae bacterium]
MSGHETTAWWRVGAIFGAFAFNYFLSALLRAVVATLAPEFAHELGLGAGELGLLAGVYFLGFACMQLPIGWLLDRFGVREVLLALTTLAVAGCAGFALARDFGELVLARLLIGMGVAASLMAPLTAFVRLFDAPLQLRLNAWMLMSGSLGMVASTLPVQALLPTLGWRNLFYGLAGAMITALILIAAATPRDRADREARAPRAVRGYGSVVRHPAFVQAAPLAVFAYGGLIAVQSLWAGPWLTEVVMVDASTAARGLFLINLSMLASFMAWGVVIPRLVSRGIGPEWLIARGWPLGAAVMLAIVLIGPAAGAPWLAAWCACTSVVTLSLPAVAHALPKAEAGRALSAFNLLIFLGVFGCQWGMGLMIDWLLAAGWSPGHSYRAAMALLLLAIAGAGVWYWSYPRMAQRKRSIAACG